MINAAANVLVRDAIGYGVFSVAAVPFAMSAAPKPRARMMACLWRTATDIPGMSSDWRMRSSRFPNLSISRVMRSVPVRGCGSLALARGPPYVTQRRLTAANVRLPAVHNGLRDGPDRRVRIVTGRAFCGFARASIAAEKASESGNCLVPDLCIAIRTQNCDEIGYDVSYANIFV